LKRLKFQSWPIAQPGLHPMMNQENLMAEPVLVAETLVNPAGDLIIQAAKDEALLVVAKILDKFETLLLDLDGVIYEGGRAIVDAIESISAIQAKGIQVGYITNNASRTSEAIAEQLRSFGLELRVDDVITSAQAGAGLLKQIVPAGSKVLVVGGEGLRSNVSLAGFQIVESSKDSPAAVIQGFDPSVGWKHLAEASYAIQQGAKWVATNQDWTIPREEGLAPGNGTLVSAVHTAVGQLPVVAGKPEKAIFETALAQFGASSAVYIGDRLDTDVLGANRAGIGSALVMTGVTTRKELLAAKADFRPTFILGTLKDLLGSYQAPVKTKRGYKLGSTEVELLGQKVLVSFGDPKSLEALKCACLTIWDSGQPIHTLDVEQALYE
jgi:HAD superfamily hydrolase (TIGR01450 family)